MKYSESLKKNIDFRKVYSERNSLANKYLVMYVAKNELGNNRIGISVSKKVGNSVIRHHITRILREIYRLNEELFKCGYDIVVIARVKTCHATYQDISKAYLDLAKLHGVLEKNKEME